MAGITFRRYHSDILNLIRGVQNRHGCELLEGLNPPCTKPKKSKNIDEDKRIVNQVLVTMSLGSLEEGLIM